MSALKINVKIIRLGLGLGFALIINIFLTGIYSVHLGRMSSVYPASTAPAVIGRLSFSLG